MKTPRNTIIAALTVWMAIACSPANFSKTPSANIMPASCTTGATCTTTGGTTTIDRVITVAASANKVDVLVVDDNSRSMQAEQLNMGTKMGSFVQKLNAAGLDWQIGIVTTDMSGTNAKQNGILVPYSDAGGALFINNQTVNASTAFADNVQMTIDSNPSTWGSGDSRGIYAAVAAIRRNQSGWMRSDAALAVIIMSNEDERKNGGQYYGLGLVSGEDYPADLLGSVPVGKSMQVHSIIIEPGDAACASSQQAAVSQGTTGDGSYGYQYATASKMSGGVIGNICASDYSSQLTQIGGAVTAQTLSSFTLDCAPTSGVTVISTTPSNLNVTTTVSGNQLNFNPVLPPGTSLHITYQCATN